MPVLFLGHGSPMTVITDVPARRAWQALGRVLPRPRAIVVVTAHWETQGRTHVTAESWPRTIHDFRNFPQALHDIRYPAPGSPELAARIVELLGPERAAADTSWGFDHGAWGVVQPMYPAADIPMVAMSLDRARDPHEHFAIGRALAPLRDEGVLIVASGNIVHNLALWRESAGTRPDWAEEFRARSNAAILAGDDAALMRFAPGDDAAHLAINSGEHYLPLLHALGARRPGDGTALFSDTLDGALSMTSVLIGDTALLAGIAGDGA
jgi:4,5-DOPA dioxygenase extradiol